MKTKNANKTRNIFAIYASFVVLIVLFISIGYSALQNSGVIEDITSTVRIEANIRITDLSIDTASNAVVGSMDYNTTVQNGTYTGKVLSDATFTNTNSSVTYKVEITNFGNAEMGIFSITGLPNNLDYELRSGNYTLGEKLCDNTTTSQCTLGAKKFLYVTIKYKSGSGSNTTTNVNTSFDLNFKGIYKIYYGGSAIDYVIDGGNKTVSLGNNPPTYVRATGTYTNFSYSSPNVTLNGVTSDITIEEIHKIYVDNVEQSVVATHGGNITVPLGSSAPDSDTSLTITGTYSSSSYTKPNLTLNGVTTNINITISSGGGNGGTWSNPVEDNTTTVYDPVNNPPDEGVTVYTQIAGEPEVEVENGKVTRFEYTNINSSTGISLPSGGVNTGVLAFDGRDFTATLTATLAFSSCTQNICPVLGAATKTTSVNGVLIYEMRVASSGYGHNASGTNQSPPYNKFRFGRYENSNATGSDDFNINSRVTSSTSSGRYGYNSSTSTVKLTFKLYYINGVFSSEIYDSSGAILAKPHNNMTITFSDTSGSTFSDITVEVGHFQHNSTYNHTFTIHEFSVVKS